MSLAVTAYRQRAAQKLLGAAAVGTWGKFVPQEYCQ